MKEIKRPSDLVSPLSWIIIIVCFSGIIVVILRPSPLELLVLFVVDIVAVEVFKFLQARFLLPLFPSLSLFFLEKKENEIAQYSESENIRLFEKMLVFPSHFSIYCFLCSFLKTIPAFAIMVFYWKHDCSHLVQFLKALSTSLVTWTYFYWAVFIENHYYISKKIAYYHEKYDWSMVFVNAKSKLSERHFIFHENLALASLWIVYIFLELILIKTHLSSAPEKLTFEIVALGIGTMILMMRIWFLGHKFYLDTLETLSRISKEFSPSTFRKDLALHSSTMLAQFESTFNKLFKKFRIYENKLSQWLTFRAEQNRYHAIGELSSMVIHEMSSPLHIMRFCTEQIKNNKGTINPRYVDELYKGSHRCHQLILSLRAFLKGSAGRENESEFSELFEHVQRLLKVRYFSKGFKAVRFHIDEDILSLKPRMSQADLIYTLVNLITYRLDSLINDKVPNPFLEIKLRSINKDRALIGITDNSTSLQSDVFNETCSFSEPFYNKTNPDRKWELVFLRKLVESFQGRLYLSRESRQDVQKTVIYLELEIIPSKETDLLHMGLGDINV